MKKRYPRKKQPSKFEGYYIAREDLLTQSTFAVDREIYALVLNLINSAKKEICIAYFQFTLDEKFLLGIPFHLYSSLKSRREEGVDIKVLLNQKFANVMQYALNRRTSRLLQKANIETRFTPTKVVLHSKVIIVDQETALIGSPNLTITSLAENLEVVALVKSKLIKEIIYKWFDDLWLANSSSSSPLVTN